VSVKRKLTISTHEIEIKIVVKSYIEIILDPAKTQDKHQTIFFASTYMKYQDYERIAGQVIRTTFMSKYILLST